MMRPREKKHTLIRRYAHGWGIARCLGSLSSSDVGLVEERVETALPLRALALYAARHCGMRVDAVESYGLLRRRWVLKPQGMRRVGRWPDGDTIPAILAPGRSTTLRPGETLLEATERLAEGEDL